MKGAEDRRLAVHGFVLAGGKSSRMGRDKAMLEFRGVPLVRIAAETLQTFCAAVSIAGNREDLANVAPVVREARLESGPAAGIEAGVQAAGQPWSMFVPVDVPLVPAGLLRRWAEAVLSREAEGVRISYLRANGKAQPVFCMLHQSCSAGVRTALEDGDRRLGMMFEKVAAGLGGGALWVAEAETFFTEGEACSRDLATCFANVNTPEDLAGLGSPRA